MAFFWVIIGVIWSDLRFNAHILWIAGGLWLDLWFNGQIFRWWLVCCDGGGYLFFSLLDLVYSKLFYM